MKGRSWYGLFFAVTTVTALVAPSHAVMLGNVDNVTKLSATEATIKCGTPAVRVKVWDDDLIRIWMDPAGAFTYYNSYNSYMTIPANFPGPSSCTITDAATEVRIVTAKLVMVIKKTPFRMLVYKPDGTTLITRNPAASTFSTDGKAFLERDATGTIEHFYGLGGNDNQTCDKRGRSLNCWDNTMYGAPTPFFMSTAGYGFFLQNDNGPLCTFDFTASPYSITATQGPLDLFFFYGPGLKYMIGQYTRLTGKPLLMPKKTFGLTYHVSVGSNNSTGEVPRFRTERYPIDNCITFINYIFNASGDQMVKDTCARFHAINVSVVGYVDLNSNLGFDASYPYDSWTTSNQLLKSRLFSLGVNTCFADELEKVGEPFQFKFMEATAKAFSEYAPTLRTMVLNRAGYTGCQRYGYWWMGDTPKHIVSAKGVIVCQLNCGLGGYPHTTHDMAGYYAGSPGTSESLIRGCQMNFIQPISQLNSYRGNQEPWYWSAEAQAIFKKFDLLHYRLMPYWYSIAWQACSDGLPGWRHLVLDYPNDNRVFTIDDEMMVGESFLFAPITDEGTSRSIYFPAGTWYNYFTGEKITGPKTVAAYSVPFNQAALFAKAGAIIPSGPDIQYVDEKPLNPLTLEIYPSANSSYTLYEDDGETTKHETENAYCTTTFTLSADNANIVFTCGATDCRNAGAYSPSYPRAVIPIFKNIIAKPAQVLANGSPLTPLASLTALNAASEGWWYDAVNTAVNVKYASSGAQTIISFAHGGSVGTADNMASGLRRPFEFGARPQRDGTLALSFRLEHAAPLSLDILSIDGRLIGTFPLGLKSAGEHQAILPATTLPKGVLILKCKAGSDNGTIRKIILR